MTETKIAFRKKWWVKVSFKKELWWIEFEIGNSFQKWEEINLKKLEENFDKKINNLIKDNS